MLEALKIFHYYFFTDPITFIVSVLNFILALYLVQKMLNIAIRSQKGSMAATFRHMAYAFVAFAAVEVITIAAMVFPASFNWDMLITFAELVFLIAVIYAIRFMKSSIEAYEYLVQKKK